MIRDRTARALATLGLITTLALTALAGPATILAATPNWQDLGIQSLPSAVTPGAEAGYRLSIGNAGPSNISQLYLVTTAGSPAPTFASTSQGSCQLTSPMVCSLGSLRKGRTASVTVAFATPAAGSASFSVDFEWNTTGLGSGGGDSSHGDAIEKTGVTALNADANFEGAFVRSAGSVANSTGLTSANQQSTQVVSPAANIPVTVADESAVSGNAGCPAALGCSTLTSEIHVNNGAVFATGLKTIIGFDSSQLAGGTNANNLDFWHQYDAPKLIGGTLVSGEQITEGCKFSGGSPTPKSLPCADVANAGGGDLVATIWLTENGRIQGW